MTPSYDVTGTRPSALPAGLIITYHWDLPNLCIASYTELTYLLFELPWVWPGF